MKQLKGIYLLCIFFMLPACMTTYQVVSFEVLEPAEITFPENLSQLLVMDRLPMAYNLSDSVTLSVLGWKDFRGLDTLMSHNISMGLYKLLQQSPADSHQFSVWDSERQSDILASSEVKLSKKEVVELCWKNRTDAILCLESCNLKLRLEDTIFVRGFIYRPHISGKLTSRWVIYLPDYPKPFLESSITDSMDYWIWPRTRDSNIYDFKGIFPIRMEGALEKSLLLSGGNQAGRYLPDLIFA